MTVDPHSTTPATPAAHILIALLKLPGVGRKTVWRALQGRDAPSSLAEAVSRLRDKTFTPQELEQASEYADAAVRASERLNIQIITIYDANYPPRLKEISDPPIVLHVKGDAGLLSWSNAVAIIGTREPTDFGRKSARRIASCAAESGASVVSGLAIGCDTEAHRGCLDANGHTVAVLAHGLDKVYPAQNKSLASEILERGGCLVSEYEVGKTAFKMAFVDRDRLQSGLSQSVILIETGLKGGSLHTIRFACEQHRLVACVKHPPKYATEEKALGNAKLIEEGTALPLSTAEDVKSVLARIASMSGSGKIAVSKPATAEQLKML